MKRSLFILFLLGMQFFSSAMENIIKHDGNIKNCFLCPYDKNKLLCCVQYCDLYEQKNSTCYMLEVYNLNDYKRVTTLYNIKNEYDITHNLVTHPNKKIFAVKQKRNNKKELFLRAFGNDRSPIDILMSDEDLYNVLFVGENKNQLYTTFTKNIDKTAYYYYSIYNLETRKNKEFQIDSKILGTLWDRLYKHLVLITIPGARHWDVEKEKLTFITRSGLVFDSNKKNVVFYNAQEKLFKVYNLEQGKVVKKQQVEADFDYAILTKNNHIIFSLNNLIFLDWDINKDALNLLFQFNKEHVIASATLVNNRIADDEVFVSDESSHKTYQIMHKDEKKSNNKPKIITNNFSHFIYFCNQENKNKIVVCDLEKNELFPIEVSSKNKPTSFYVNEQKTYALYREGDQFILFDMNGWEKIREFIFEEEVVAPSFSPCGRFVVLGTPTVIEFYDIEAGVSHFVSEYSEGFGTKPLFFGKFFVFKPTHKTVLIYDYEYLQEIEIECENEITNFIINDEGISISFGTTTQFYIWKDLKFKRINKKDNAIKETKNVIKDVDTTVVEVKNDGYTCVIL